MHRDPVCGKKVNANKAYVQIVYEGTTYYLCCPLCQSQFEKDPKKYIQNRKNGRSKRGN